MCGHFLEYRTYQYLKRPNVLWRCSTCGRESSAPIDCCNRPDFEALRSPGMACIVMRKLINGSSQLLTRIRAIMRRRQRPTLQPIVEPGREYVAYEVPKDAEVELVAHGHDD